MSAVARRDLGKTTGSLARNGAVWQGRVAATRGLPPRGRARKLDFVSGLRIAEIRRDNGKLIVHGLDAERRCIRLDDIDEIICATGQRPDLSLTSELRVRLDPWLESTEALGPLIDPNVHSCGTVRPHGHRELAHPEPGLYTVGVKSYGRAPTFLMATGFEQARSVVAAIDGDLAAADRVELHLPETGACGLAPRNDDSSAGCCGDGAPTAAVAAAAVGPAPCGPRSCSARRKGSETVTAAATT